MKKQTLSVVISVFNGEKWFDNCLASIEDIADEIVVVDHHSTDATLTIVKKYTKKIFQQENNQDNIDEQKNYGFEKATSDWILSLDSDEEITEALQNELNLFLEKEHTENAYYIPRKNMIFGKWIEHTGWYPDKQLRLFRKGKARYTSKHVHEQLQVEGTKGELTNNILHHNYDSIMQFLQRSLFVYAPNEADEKLSKGYTFSYRDAIQFPFQEFLRRYFVREGYKDGFYGLMLSLLMSVYHLIVFAYIWEKNGFTDKEYPKDLLKNELSKAKKELIFWENKKNIDNEKNIVSKTFMKIKRKLSS